jgi:Fur family ferric uptake transcriptional regulator
MGELRKLHQYLHAQGMKITQQREEIAETFLKANRHASAEELYRRVHRTHPEVGLSTVYRTLKLLVDSGLASRREFGDGITRYEPRSGEGHHDHLICIRCGAIIEFKNQEIEALQKEVAERKGFTVTRHRLEIYGYCDRCRSTGRARKQREKDRKRFR